MTARGARVPSRTKFRQSEKVALARFRLLAETVELGKQARGRCLEIGCGAGSFLRLMKAAGWEVNGLEPDPVYALAGRERYGVPITTETYEKTVWPSSTFDLVTLFHVLEHVPSPRAFLGKVARELKKDGLVYLEVPTVERPYGGDLDRFFWSAHLYSFSSKTLSGLLQQIGFEPVAEGHRGDFLWIVARFTDDPKPAVFPLHDPEIVHRNLVRKYRRYKAEQKCSALRILGKGKRYIDRQLEEVAKQPKEVWPGMYRMARRAQVRTSQFPFVRLPFNQIRGDYLVHFGMHVPGNAGDTLLFHAVRDVFDRAYGTQHWSLEPLWPEVTAGDITRINREAKGIVIGGGGLLLRDTNPDSYSGWQWNCPTSVLRQIEVPLTIFAIGYNRFRGQADFDPVFTKNIRALVDQSAFFGLRNRGSIRALSEYLTETQTARLLFQPCPTTLLRFLHPRFEAIAFQGTKNYPKRELALNIAFDRWHMRFQGEEERILNAVAQAMKWATNQGWEINLVIHSGGDDTIIPWLLNAQVPFREVRLDGRPPRQILRFYQKVSLTIGMRGHSQMIPFGVGNAIISLISHDKLRYFLDDIGHPEWGIDVQEKGLADALITKIDYVYANARRIQQEIWAAQRSLWEITKTNLRLIEERTDLAS